MEWIQVQEDYEMSCLHSENSIQFAVTHYVFGRFIFL